MPPTTTPAQEVTPPRTVFYAIGALSVAVAAFLFWLIYFQGKHAAPAWVSSLPAANAVFNSLSALCLAAGYLQIRRRARTNHMRWMLSAAGFSALFLVSYITYHYFFGDTKFQGQGWIRPVYFSILASHILLSMVALPLIFATLYCSLSGKFRFHRKVARWTFPIWMYVSVTGVVVFFVLRAY